MKKSIGAIAMVAASTLLFSCKQNQPEKVETEKETSNTSRVNMEHKIDAYAEVKLTSDITSLSENQRQMVAVLIEAADIMNELFWMESYGEKDSLMAKISDAPTRKYAEINYGPWDRLGNDSSFVEGIGKKPEGANFYPDDMSKEEFEKADLKDKASLYTFIRRDKQGNLYTIPYHEMFAEKIKTVANLLKDAASLAEDEGFKKYLNMRAEALLTDNYQLSDLAWMDMKSNDVDVVIGPIETYEDQLFGYKASHEAYVLIKDKDWSQRLEKYAAFLPELQRNLPVEAKYKAETPGSDAQLNAYDVVYYAGASNAGSKTIAINLPNDEEVQLKKGTRRLQLKNAMRAKFDKIMVPISDVLITPEQRSHVTFDAFFANTMFHEVAHGLGIKNTITGKGTVREALKEHASALEEGKADILGLYMIQQLLEKDELEGQIEDYYVTFMAGIFRSVRFGASSAHGAANMIRFNYFKEKGAFERQQDGTYKVNIEKMRDAIDSLSGLILTLQGNGDYEGVAKLVDEKGKVGPQLQEDLDRLEEADIPVDIVFEQGKSVLGVI